MEPDALKKLYQDMLRIRRVEERIALLYPEKKMRCPVHLCIGQEAVAVGACAALEARDLIATAHRSHGHYLAKGGSLRALMAELYGKATGCCQGKGGSMHLVDLAAGCLGAAPIVGSTIPIGVGAAFASVMRGEERVVAIFFGEGATEEGVFHESMNFAALKSLPVVFVCENNLYSVYSPLSVRQPLDREVFWMARGYGMEGLQGDGNDPVEVQRLVSAAAAKARGGGGPTFLELMTYRWREHCGPSFDNHAGYRSEAEFEAWKRKCPIERLRRLLLEEQLAADGELEEMSMRIEGEIDEAVAFAEESPFPDRSLLARHVYAPPVRSQQENRR